MFKYIQKILNYIFYLLYVDRKKVVSYKLFYRIENSILWTTKYVENYNKTISI